VAIDGISAGDVALIWIPPMFFVGFAVWLGTRIGHVHRETRLWHFRASGQRRSEEGSAAERQRHFVQSMLESARNREWEDAIRALDESAAVAAAAERERAVASVAQRAERIAQRRADAVRHAARLDSEAAQAEEAATEAATRLRDAATAAATSPRRAAASGGPRRESELSRGRAALREAKTHRSAYLEARATQRGAELAAATRRREANPPTDEPQRLPGWAYVNERLLDRRPFRVRVDGAFDGGLRVEVGGIPGVIPSSTLVGEDRESTFTSAQLIGRDVIVVAVSWTASGAALLSERDAVDEWTAWPDLWRHRVRQDVFDVIVTDPVGTGPVVSCEYEGCLLRVARNETVPQWIPGGDETASDRHGDSGRMAVVVSEYDRDRDILLVSEQSALESLLYEGRATGELFVGEVVHVEAYGAFVRIAQRWEGFLHKSEMDWDIVDDVDIQEQVEVGQHIPVVITRVERRRGDRGLRIELSLRRSAWPRVRRDTQVGDVVTGRAFDVSGDEVLFQIPGPAVGRAHRRDIIGHRRPGERVYITDILVKDDIVPLMIMNIRDDLLRFDVSYREGRAIASERGGWKFDQRGRVIAIPTEAELEFLTDLDVLAARHSRRAREASNQAVPDVEELS
jgi:ribosomal protein S1